MDASTIFGKRKIDELLMEGVEQLSTIKKQKIADEDKNNSKNSTNVQPLPYKGTITCTFKDCKKPAYFFCGLAQDKNFRCGNHSRAVSLRKSRNLLPDVPKQVKILALQQERKTTEIIAEQNRREGKKGQVVCSKMYMMKSPENIHGFVKVYPNNRHQERKDGFGCASLSPMRLGPVLHNQPGLPIAKNIENFHQGSKCFKEELAPLSPNEPGKLFFKNQKKFFEDEVPHRHKYINKESGNGNKNIPKFFVWIDKQGQIHKLDYITSRQFYCNFYERLAKNQPDYKRLCKMRDDGYNIQICGYDGRSINKEDIEKEYLDDTKPFGHELVLFTMLSIPENEYPWRKYKTFDF